MSDLEKLIKAVEGGNLHPLDLLCIDAISHGRAQKAFDGSLDAAKALHEALLPGWRLNILREDDETSPGWLCHLVERNRRPLHTVHVYDQPNAARAWLLALLRAYAAQQETAP